MVNLGSGESSALPVFLGYDPREKVAYDVAVHSLRRHASRPLNIRAIGSSDIDRPILKRGGQLYCPISQAPMSTEFAISRFAVPFLHQEGWALFADCDILAVADVAELFAMADDRYALMVVKHDYKPKEAVKMDGQVQTQYDRKNWSSVILWNCSHPAHDALTVDDLENRKGLDLHRFFWLSDDQIGALPLKWNWLAGVSESVNDLGVIHYTLGGPWFDDWKGGPKDELWLDEFRLMERQWARDCLTSTP